METNEIFGSAEEKKVEAPKKTKKTVAKKPATPKSATKKAEPKKTTTVKTEAAKTTEKAETVKTESKPAVKKPAAKKTTTTAKKPAAKKATTTTKKTTVKKELFIQYYQNQVDEDTLVERVLADCKEQNITVKDLKMYLKPEDNACYYVANNSVAGKVDLF